MFENQLKALVQLSALFQGRLKKTGATPRVVQKSPVLLVGETALPRVDTIKPPRVVCRINEPYPRVGTIKTSAQNIPYYINTIYRA